jgi:endonuclease G, mitochondrial
MTAPSHVAESARARVREKLNEIRHSLQAIAEERPEDAEYDKARQAAVIERRLQVEHDRAARMAASDGREKKWGPTIDFVDAVFLERGMHAAKSVARVVTRDGQDIGTGFMISPRVFLTNNHVIPSETAARGLVVEFNYERDVAGVMKTATRFALAPSTLFVTNHEDDLDYTAVALGTREGIGQPLDFGYLPISGSRDKHQLSDHVNIIQHPDGRPKEAVLRENQLVARAKTALHYVADTEPGSSGSPVFNVLWQVVALHHWGGPHRDLVDDAGRPLAKTVNEGIRISAIVGDLNTRKNNLAAEKRDLVNEVLTIGLEPEAARPTATAEQHVPTFAEGASVMLAQDGTATWTLPLRVSVQLGGPAVVPRPAVPFVPATQAPLNAPRPAALADERRAAEATLQLDANYANRSGYDPAFLEGDPIALPALTTEAMRADASINNEPVPGRDHTELPYEHFSVVMNGRRRLAFFTATNIDGATAKNYDRRTGEITDPHDEDDDGAEASERWFSERRIPENEQTPPKFYEGQTAFDANGRPIEDRRTAEHRDRIFQQGHLTRRQDPLWGDEDELIYRANADTFHVTNRAPQVGYFNMGTRKRNAESGHPGGQLHWRAIEDFVLNNAVADKQRVTVFTGPVFDDKHDIPWDRGAPGMKGFKAPREYWKLILRREHGVLRATALIADQTPLIDYVPERILTDAEIKTVSFSAVKAYHCSVQELEQRTGLDFGGPVRDADTHAGGERRPVRTIEEALGESAAGAVPNPEVSGTPSTKRPRRGG